VREEEYGDILAETHRKVEEKEDSLAQTLRKVMEEGK
jgi:Cft2 family RNA processing exonuclease